MAILLGGLIGSAIAFLTNMVFTTTQTPSDRPVPVAEVLEVLDPPATAHRARVVGAAVEASEAERGRAKNELARARSALRRQDAKSAIDAFGACIRAADLPDCHLELGLLLLITRDGSGYAHLERYLALEPAPRDADALRALLASVQTSTGAR